MENSKHIGESLPKLVDVQKIIKDNKFLLVEKEKYWNWIILDKDSEKLIDALDGKNSLTEIFLRFGIKNKIPILKNILDLWKKKLLLNFNIDQGSSSQGLFQKPYPFLKHFKKTSILEGSPINDSIKFRWRLIVGGFTLLTTVLVLGNWNVNFQWSSHIFNTLTFFFSFTLITALRTTLMGFIYFDATQNVPNVFFRISLLRVNCEFPTHVLSFNKKLAMMYGFIDILLLLGVSLFFKTLLGNEWGNIIWVNGIFLTLFELHPLRPSALTHFIKITFHRDQLTNILEYTRKRVLFDFINNRFTQEVKISIFYYFYSFVYYILCISFSWYVLLNFSREVLWKNALDFSNLSMTLFLLLFVSTFLLDFIFFFIPHLYTVFEIPLKTFVKNVMTRKGEIKTDDISVMLKEHPFFFGLGEYKISQLIKNREIKKTTQSLICDVGTVFDNKILVLVEGEINVFRQNELGKKTHFATLTSPEVIGGESLFSPITIHSELLSKGTCQYFYIDKKRLEILSSEERGYIQTLLEKNRFLIRKKIFENVPYEFILGLLKLGDYSQGKIESSEDYFFISLEESDLSIYEKNDLNEKKQFWFIKKDVFWNFLSLNINSAMEIV